MRNTHPDIFGNFPKNFQDFEKRAAGGKVRLLIRGMRPPLLAWLSPQTPNCLTPFSRGEA